MVGQHGLTSSEVVIRLHGASTVDVSEMRLELDFLKQGVIFADYVQ
jgi:hypothetical protein